MTSDGVSHPEPAQTKDFPLGCILLVFLFGLVGVAALFWSWHGATGSLQLHWPGLREVFATDTRQATGVVVRNGDAGSPTSTGAYPVVQFEVNGKTYEFKGAARGSVYLPTGTHVSVVYHAANPAQAHIRRIDQFVAALVIAGIGLVVLAFSVLCLTLMLRSK